MSSSDAQICPACGARNPAGADRCELCGEALTPTPEPTGDTTSDAAAVGDEAAEQVFCNQCGWKNPVVARFCSRCGTPLQDLTGALGSPPAEMPPQPHGVRPAGLPSRPVPSGAAETAGEEGGVESVQTADEGVGRQVGLLVAVGVVLVVALFLVTSLSKDLAAPPPAAQSPSATGEMHDAVPLPPAVAGQVEALESEIEAATGDAKLGKQQELVNLLVGVGRFAQAARVQEAVAEETQTAEAWRRTGDLYYDLMNTLQDATKRTAADRSVAAYQKALEQDPGNRDIRTDMATAYLNSSSPMQGVQTIKAVLEEDPEHIQARFNYGLMLSMINRPEQAIEQFEIVKELVGEEAPYYRQADEAIRAIRSQIGT